MILTKGDIIMNPIRFQFQLLRPLVLVALFPLLMYAADPQRGNVGELAIDVWYGNTQNFGAIGNPVPAIDIVGNVSPAKNTVMFYTLNGGAQETLSLGPDQRRLERLGDFNADIPYKNLSPGANQVVFTAKSTNNAKDAKTKKSISGRKKKGNRKKRSLVK